MFHVGTRAFLITDQCYMWVAGLTLGLNPVQALEENKLKEIKNGRLAMIAFVGFVAQHAATGKVIPTQ